MKKSLKNLLKISFRIYKKNFLRLILPFGSLSLILGFIVLFRLIEFTMSFSVLFFAVFLSISLIFCCGVVVNDSFNSLRGNEIELGDSWKRVTDNLVNLYLAFLMVFVPFLLLFLLLFEFWSYFIGIPLLLLPFFSIYIIPEILISLESPIEGVKNSFQTTWNNLFKSALIFFPFLLAGVYIFVVFSFWVPILCFLLPFWLVLITVAYMNTDRFHAKQRRSANQQNK